MKKSPSWLRACGESINSYLALSDGCLATSKQDLFYGLACLLDAQGSRRQADVLCLKLIQSKVVLLHCVWATRTNEPLSRANITRRVVDNDACVLSVQARRQQRSVRRRVISSSCDRDLPVVASMADRQPN